MAFADYRRDLQDSAKHDNQILDVYYHRGPSHAFIGAPDTAESSMKDAIADALHSTFNIRPHPLQIVLCGSAHLGFSPVPVSGRFGNPFNPTSSDLDFCIVVEALFNKCWNELRDGRVDPKIEGQMAADIYWGLINPHLVRDLTEFGKKWWQVFGAIKTDRGRGVRGRLYRDFWSMQSYHLRGIADARRKLATSEL